MLVRNERPQTSKNPLAKTKSIDRKARSALGQMSGGLSPLALASVLSDWSVHLATSPGKQMALWQQAADNMTALARFATSSLNGSQETEPPTAPKPGDRRFQDETWSQFPFSLYQQGFLLAEEWVESATTGIAGVSAADERAMSFTARQVCDVFSPSNFLLTNPEVIRRTQDEKGANLTRGASHFVADAANAINGTARPKPSAFVVGENLATTPGRVVFRNHLIELIQYDPTTKTVHPEPLLIVPAWIMKYYILDLSQENSMVRYLTSQGFTVFMISWRNPGSEDAELGMEDYLEQGPLAALDTIQTITKSPKVHAAGYCLGGTLLSIAAAAMARDGDDRLASVTLLTAQTDFTEAGELMLFINESQISFLEDIMQDKGYLEGSRMAGAFQVLQSNNLIWSRMKREYLLGERSSVNDMMAWNADTTRMPARMHSDYLRKLFLENELASGKYEVGDHPVALRDVHVPIFAVGTETDHVAPWKSVFKIHTLCHSDVTFVLTKGGHNTGIVSEPGHRGRHFHVHTVLEEDHYLSPDDWTEAANLKEGSWWPEWTTWLSTKSGKHKTPPKFGRSLAPAPGTYVMME